MTRPDWASEAEWEKAIKIADVWQHPLHHDYQVFAEDVCLALIQAKNKGKREAAEIAAEYDGDGMNAGQDSQLGDAGLTKHEISQAILSSLQKEPT